MIYRCPFCGHVVTPALRDGLTTCDNCHRIFTNAQFYKLLAAAWVIRREHAYDSEVLKYRCDLSQDEADLVYHFVVELGYSHDEFLKELAKRGIKA